jgi:hypothetical protein
MRTSIIAALVCVLWLGGLDITLGQPNKALYELKERCGKVAREYFAKEHGQDVDKSRDGEMKLKFENHYSTRLDKCFFLLITTSRGGSNMETMTLYDLNDNKEYGHFAQKIGEKFAMGCWVQDKPFCRSKSEWVRLIKPYMTH